MMMTTSIQSSTFVEMKGRTSATDHVEIIRFHSVHQLQYISAKVFTIEYTIYHKSKRNKVGDECVGKEKQVDKKREKGEKNG
ncbi:unnamed protein product [Onchocerca flexuosa]|uniref:Ovule protein n=1 Tax=Onchocerca flexuosa TaxID=387005 RepID=A0A183HM80_9BILA|nr:unnamed protein product [Onchocerca flexuosa]